ncbi:hypothetical protein [Facklamia sp. 7083-14-GEN3]|uniref:hypothetical protein n=1 Tax=Facklamia sp. 7083-14-GEN3 TaxID=2973478 RepID=UPI00215BBC6D|nr:hypothetical protein [Facklamia sp. 7083-14-GEN3]MCR8969589.1 hypothetical protein [Facklamia sp. 7083-14-GEN3]
MPKLSKLKGYYDPNKSKYCTEIQQHNALLRTGTIYAQLDFELKIIREIFHEEGYYNYQY